MLKPNQVIFENKALTYPLGQTLEAYFKAQPTRIAYLAQNKLKGAIEGDTPKDYYQNGKKTLVFGVKKSAAFQSCKPSAHYQLPLVSGCSGQCEYCYLNTRLGDKPYIKAHVNIDEILQKAKAYIEERAPEVTIFEGAATSDPVPVEPYTHALEQAILFFAKEPLGRFRFVTKYDDVDTLVGIAHEGHTEVRFSINTDTVIKQYERGTASRDKRLEASIKMIQAGYPVGFLVAPVFIYPGWEEEYTALLRSLKEKLPQKMPYPLTFEIISHRYTTTAKNRIMEIFPDTTLPMTDEERRYKHGQFGYGKYVYVKEDMAKIKALFQTQIPELFPQAELKYII